MSSSSIASNKPSVEDDAESCPGWFDPYRGRWLTEEFAIFVFESRTKRKHPGADPTYTEALFRRIAQCGVNPLRTIDLDGEPTELTSEEKRRLEDL